MKRLFLALLIFTSCYADDTSKEKKQEVIVLTEGQRKIELKFELSGDCKEAEIRQLDIGSDQYLWDYFGYITVFPWSWETAISQDSENGVFDPLTVSLVSWNRYDVGPGGVRANLTAKVYYKITVFNQPPGDWQLLGEITNDGPFCYAIVSGEVL